MKMLGMARRVARQFPFLVKCYRALRVFAPDYRRRLAAEAQYFDKLTQVHDLPAIFHYWANKYLRPRLESCGIASIDDLFIQCFMHAAEISAPPYRFVSIGAGNGDAEIRVAVALRDAGVGAFVIDCIELSPAMIARGQSAAKEAGVGQHIRFVAEDFNFWHPSQAYHGVMANQSLHHVLKLEHLFGALKQAMVPGAWFAVNDVIGRNGHMRWPEALEIVHEFWRELPKDYRYNLLLRRHEELYDNWDCAQGGFEGIRAQDVLPLLLRYFHFQRFFAYGNVIDPFIDRAFGHHFNAEGVWDRDFIDRLHARDDQEIRNGNLKPCHIIAMLGLDAETKCQYWDNLSPEFCVRPVSL